MGQIIAQASRRGSNRAARTAASSLPAPHTNHDRKQHLCRDPTSKSMIGLPLAAAILGAVAVSLVTVIRLGLGGVMRRCTARQPPRPYGAPDPGDRVVVPNEHHHVE